jgi:AcrR family transcriptional regulator
MSVGEQRISQTDEMTAWPWRSEEEELQAPPSPKERMLSAMLGAVAELGYAKASVAEVLERAGAARQSFYNEWGNREDCFVEAHSIGMEIFVDRVFDAGAEQKGWRERLRAGLTQLLDLVVQDPETARALFVEVHACRPALPTYYAALDRFADALDKAREEPGLAQSDPPPRTGAIVVGGIEQIIRLEVIEESSENVWRLLPDLMHFAVLPYLGPEAAQAELASAPLAPSAEGAHRRREKERRELNARIPATNGHRAKGAPR